MRGCCVGGGCNAGICHSLFLTYFIDPDNDNSTCAFGNRMCPEGVRCFERRDEDRAFNECDTRKLQNNDSGQKS